VLAVEAGVADGDQAIGVHGGHGAGQAPPAAELDVDVVGPGCDLSMGERGDGQLHGLVADLAGLAPPELAGGQ
jgi:hypothetical protein